MSADGHEIRLGKHLEDLRALPPTRADDRALVAGSIAAVAAFLVAGCFEYNFGDSEVIDLLWIVMAFPFACAGEGSRPATAAPEPV